LERKSLGVGGSPRRGGILLVAEGKKREVVVGE